MFSSANDSDSVESKDNGTPATPRNVPTGGGLFEDEDEDEDDDFFSGKSLKKSDSGKVLEIGILEL